MQQCSRRVAGDMLTRLVIADTEGPGANGIPTDEVQEFLNDCDRRGELGSRGAGVVDEERRLA